MIARVFTVYLSFIPSEAVDTFLRKDFIRKEYNELTERAANMGTCLKTEVFNTATKLMEHYLLEVKHCFVPKDAVAQVATPHQLLDAVYQDFMGFMAEVGYSRNEYIQQTIATSYAVEHIQETIATSHAGDVRTIHEGRIHHAAPLFFQHSASLSTNTTPHTCP